MEDALHKLNAFLAPGTDYPEPNAAETTGKAKEDVFFRFDKALLQDLEADEILELLIRELHVCAPLLQGIRDQYENFLSSGDHVEKMALLQLSGSETNGASTKPETRADAKHDSSRSCDATASIEKDVPVAPNPRLESCTNGRSSPNVRSRRLIDRKLRSGAHHDLEVAVLDVRNVHEGAGFDWTRVKKCSQSLQGVVEVIPIYSQTFERVAERLSTSRPLLASALLHVWKMHLEVLMAVLSRCKQDMAPDAENAQLVKDIKRLANRYDSNRQLLAHATQEIDVLNRQRNELQGRLAGKEETLSALVEQERLLFTMEQDFEHLVTLAKQEFEFEQARAEADVPPAAASETTLDDSQEKPEDHRDSDVKAQLQKVDEREEDSEAVNDDESGAGGRGDDNKESTLCISEMLGKGLLANAKASPDGKQSLSSQREEDDALTVPRSLSRCSGTTCSSSSSDSLGEAMELAEEEAIEKELAAMNKEIEDVEREVERAQEAREKEREVRRRKQLIKVKDLDVLRALCEEVESLTLRFERSYTQKRQHFKHEDMLHLASWETSENEEAQLDKRRTKKKPQGKGSSSPKKARASPTKKKAQVSKNGKDKASQQPDQAKRAVLRSNAAPLSRFDIPASVLASFRTPADDSVFTRGGGRITWSLRNVFEAITRVHFWVLDRRRRAYFERDPFATRVADVFHEEYGDIDLADCALANFHLSLIRWKTTRVGIEVFRKLCDAPSDLVCRFYDFLAALQPRLLQDADAGALWTDLELVRGAAKRCFLSSVYEKTLSRGNESPQTPGSSSHHDDAATEENIDVVADDVDDDDIDDDNDMRKGNSVGLRMGSKKEQNEAWRLMESELEEFACKMEGEAELMICVDDVAMLLLQSGSFGQITFADSETSSTAH